MKGGLLLERIGLRYQPNRNRPRIIIPRHPLKTRLSTCARCYTQMRRTVTSILPALLVFKVSCHSAHVHAANPCSAGTRRNIQDLPANHQPCSFADHFRLATCSPRSSARRRTSTPRPSTSTTARCFPAGRAVSTGSCNQASTISPVRMSSFVQPLRRLARNLTGCRKPRRCTLHRRIISACRVPDRVRSRERIRRQEDDHAIRKPSAGIFWTGRRSFVLRSTRSDTSSNRSSRTSRPGGLCPPTIVARSTVLRRRFQPLSGRTSTGWRE